MALPLRCAASLRLADTVLLKIFGSATQLSLKAVSVSQRLTAHRRGGAMNLLNFIPSPAGARKANERSGELWLRLSDARQVSDLPVDFPSCSGL